jgi:hypothetical protein
MSETAAQRYARDQATAKETDRKTRENTGRSTERKSREYVDTEGTGNSAITGGAPSYS